MTVFIIRVMIALMVEAVAIFETLVDFYKTTWLNIPEGCHLHLEVRYLCKNSRTLRKDILYMVTLLL
jgi:hypothetical protein